jgi:hypothetical protein
MAEWAGVIRQTVYDSGTAVTGDRSGHRGERRHRGHRAGRLGEAAKASRAAPGRAGYADAGVRLRSRSLTWAASTLAAQPVSRSTCSAV